MREEERDGPFLLLVFVVMLFLFLFPSMPRMCEMLDHRSHFVGRLLPVVLYFKGVLPASTADAILT